MNPTLHTRFQPAALSLSLLLAFGQLAHGATQTQVTTFSYTGYGELETRTQAPGDSWLQVITQYGYDAAGRPLSTKVTGQSETGQALPARGASQSYSADGRFVASRSNALGQGEAYSYHPVFGAPLTVTAVDGSVTRWEYDAAGRKTRELRPDGSIVSWVYSACNGNCSGQSSGQLTAAWSVSETVTDSNGQLAAPTVTRYYSASDLLLVSETLGFDGRTSIVRNEYDNQGRLSKQSKPYFAGQTAVYTLYEYDDRHRAKRQTAPDGTVTQIEYGADGNKQALVTIANALGQKTVKRYNSQQLLTEVRDALNQPLSYKYTPFGQLAQTVDVKGNTTTIEYDLYGRKTRLLDPNLGSWSYAYNSLGELSRQTDAKQQTSLLEYDLLGRLTKRSEADLISSWQYDSAANGIGKLAQASTSTGYLRSHQYDSVGREVQTTVTLGSDGSYSKQLGYDAAGRLSSVSYPTGLKVAYQYNANGYLQSLVNGSNPAKRYWLAETVDAAGRPTRVQLANGASAVNKSYDNRDHISSVDAGAAFKESYTYDGIGNLKTRNLQISAGTPYQYNESFAYDALNRLTKASGDNPVSTQDISYDALGNITYKSGVGYYSYPASGPGVVRPHAITVLKNLAGVETGYEYDANGNLLRNEGRSVSWTSYNLPNVLSGNGQSETYWYDAEHERIKQVSSQNGTQLYFNPGKGSGLFYEKTIATDGKIEHKQYLSVLGEVVGEVVKRDSPAVGQVAEEERYWVKDHLGSNRAVLGSNGQLLESLGFDAWGKRRYASGQTDAANPGIAGVTTDRGYTGHEHLDELGLINMNARIYDPLLGRFLSSDPEISAPDDLQDYNRYSYAWNNPLSYTDPSGERECENTCGPGEHYSFGGGKVAGTLSGRNLDRERGQKWENLERSIKEKQGAISGNIISQANLPGALVSLARDIKELRSLCGRCADTVGSFGVASDHLGLEPVGANPVDYASLGLAQITRAIAKIAMNVVKPAMPKVVYAESAVQAAKLAKSLASQQQVGELARGGGVVVAGAGTGTTLRDAPRLAAEYGGQPSDWAKISSSSYKAVDGVQIETHAYKNVKTGKTGRVVEPKSIKTFK